MCPAAKSANTDQHMDSQSVNFSPVLNEQRECLPRHDSVPLGGGAPPSRVPGVNAPPLILRAVCRSRKEYARKVENNQRKCIHNVFKACACFEQSNVLKVNVLNSAPHGSSVDTFFRKMSGLSQIHTQRANRSSSTEIQLRAF